MFLNTALEAMLLGPYSKTWAVFRALDVHLCVSYISIAVWEYSERNKSISSAKFKVMAKFAYHCFFEIHNVARVGSLAFIFVLIKLVNCAMECMVECCFRKQCCTLVSREFPSM